MRGKPALPAELPVWTTKKLPRFSRRKTAAKRKEKSAPKVLILAEGRKAPVTRSLRVAVVLVQSFGGSIYSYRKLG